MSYPPHNFEALATGQPVAPSALDECFAAAAANDFSTTGLGAILPDKATDTVFTTVLAVNAGKAVWAPGQTSLFSPATVPLRTTVSGVDGNPSQPVFGESIYARYSLLLVNQTASAGLTLSRGAVLERMTLAYGGLPPPPTTPTMGEAMTAAFAGTAVNIVDADSCVRDLMIAGFATGINVAPNSSPGAGARVRLHNIKLHTTNGIFCSNQFDVARISDVHMWPFLYVDVNGEPNADYVSPGYGLWLQGGFDQGTVERVFAFGKTKGFILDNVRAATLRSCQVDSGDGATSNQPTGFAVENNCWGLRFEDCGAESQWLALNLDTTYTGPPTEPTATFIGGRFNSNNITAQIGRGNYLFIGTTFGNSGAPCINVSAQAGNIDLVKPVFLGSVTQPIVIDPAYTGHINILLAGPQAPSAGFVGSSIPQALIDNGQVNIMMADILDIDQDIMTRPLTNVGVQPVTGFYSTAAPSGQRNIRWTTGSDGTLRAQLLNDLGTAGRGDLVRFYSNPSGVAGFGTGVLPQYASDTLAKAGGLIVGDWYFNGTTNTQIRS